MLDINDFAVDDNFRKVMGYTKSNKVNTKKVEVLIKQLQTARTVLVIDDYEGRHTINLKFNPRNGQPNNIVCESTNTVKISPLDEAIKLCITESALSCAIVQDDVLFVCSTYNGQLDLCHIERRLNNYPTRAPFTTNSQK